VDSIGSVLFPENPLSLSDFVSFGNEQATTLQSSSFFHKADATLLLTRPMHLAKGVTLTPRLGAKWLYYDERENGGSLGTSDRWIGEAGFDLAYRFSADWDFNYERWDINGLRHVSRIITNYRYLPSSEKDLSSSPQFDYFLYRPEKPNINITDLRFTDTLNDSQIVRVGWENLFQTKRKSGETHTLARLNLYQDFLIDGVSSGNARDALYIESAFSPFPWLELEWVQKFETDGFNAESTFVRTRISSSDLWSASILAEYLEGAIDQYALDVNYRISENFGVFAFWQYDNRLDSWSEQKYGISRRFANSWILQLYVNLNDNNQRESDFSVGMRLKWLTF
jgi:lipopolysaccharide assembly outer membrane protein LptD (OstA)